MVWGARKSRLFRKRREGATDAAAGILGPIGKKIPKKKSQSVQDIKIGDKINLLDSPWKDCRGMYPCKAIRRPIFVEEVMLARAGCAGARAVAQSSKQYLMIVDRHVIEFTRLNSTTGRVAFVTLVDELFKMRLRRQEMIALFFKMSPEEPLTYACAKSTQVSDEKRAVRGSGLVQREAIHRALHFIQEIQAQERALEYQPSKQRVDAIKSLYIKAAQQFEIAGDVRQEEVLMYMKKFMAMPLVVSLLDGSFKLDEYKVELSREPEILERSFDEVEDDEISVLSGSWEPFDLVEKEGEKKSEEKPFNVTMDEIILEARQDFETLNVDDNDGRVGSNDGGEEGWANFDRVGSADGERFADFGRVGSADGEQLEDFGRVGSADGEQFADFGRVGSDDTFANLEAMMKEADRELDEIMKM